MLPPHEHERVKNHSILVRGLHSKGASGGPRGALPAVCGPQTAQGGWECSPTQSYKLKHDEIFCVMTRHSVSEFTQFQCHSLLCGPRQLFFQCVAEMPKDWTPLP